MKEVFIIFFSAFIGIFAMIYAHNCRKQARQLEIEKNSLSVEMAHAQVPMMRDTIRESIEVVSQMVVEVVPDKLKDALEDNEKLIKELQIKVKQLEALQTTTIETRDTKPAHHNEDDSIFFYNDQWTDIRLSLKDSTFYYNIRDSLSSVVYREYKYHFLWWKWGTKGYQIKIVNFNPHSRVTYNKFIKAEK